MQNVTISFAKITSDATQSSWPLAYNAGNLFASVSLSGTPEDDQTLSALGREMMSRLETEFFTLEKKDLSGIKSALEASITHIPISLRLSYCVAYVKDSALYLFSSGGGQAVLQRKSKLGNLLTSSNSEIITASGYLQTDDILLLATDAFMKSLPLAKLSEAFTLQLPSNMADFITPLLESSVNGAAAGLILTFAIPTHLATENNTLPTNPPVAGLQEEDLPLQTTRNTQIDRRLNVLSRFKRSGKKVFFLLLAGLILLILVTMAIFTLRRQTNTKSQAIFQEIYPTALKYYDEGVNLESLNQEYAKSDFLKAKQILLQGQNNILRGSNEEKKLQALLTQVEAKLAKNDSSRSLNARMADANASILLTLESQSPQTLAATEDEGFVYLLHQNGITQIDKGNQKAKEIIKKSALGNNAQSIASYLGNLYVLNKNDGVYKFSPSGTEFVKSSYFKTSTPALEQTISLSIDGSVWLLEQNGIIRKFTKGTSDPFILNGLTQPFSHPKKIYTTPDMTYLYVLDSGNSRIVKIEKSGNYASEYKIALLKTATDFIISEKDKKIIFLANNSLWVASL